MSRRRTRRDEHLRVGVALHPVDKVLEHMIWILHVWGANWVVVVPVEVAALYLPKVIDEPVEICLL